ncbi:hypothetical protein KY285_007791 [Solanum tuberosum]|nr:hypothetical protein KY289_008145 [Solanum tuberosum]KAH0746134.1 hypothetical protein KY285_007791 [Solanum tuberosum]
MMIIKEDNDLTGDRAWSSLFTTVIGVQLEFKASSLLFDEVLSSLFVGVGTWGRLVGGDLIRVRSELERSLEKGFGSELL